MRKRQRIRGITYYAFTSGRLSIRVAHICGKTENLFCTFPPLIKWIAGTPRATILASLRHHEMIMETDDGEVQMLTSVAAARSKGLKQKAGPGKPSSREPVARKPAARIRRRNSSDQVAESAGVRVCPACHDVVNTVMSLERGKRIYRCKDCGGITGYA